MVKGMENRLSDHSEKLNQIQRLIEQIAIRQRGLRDYQNNVNIFKNFIDTFIIIVVVFFVQYVIKVWTGSSETKGMWYVLTIKISFFN